MEEVAIFTDDLELLAFCANMLTLHLHQSKLMPSPYHQYSPLLVSNAIQSFNEHQQYLESIVVNNAFGTKTMLSQNFLARERKRIIYSCTPNITFCLVWLEYIKASLTQLHNDSSSICRFGTMTMKTPCSPGGADKSFTQFEALSMHLDDIIKRHELAHEHGGVMPRKRWPNMHDLAVVLKFMLTMLDTIEKDMFIARQRGDEAYALIFGFMDHVWGFATVNTKTTDLKFQSLSEVPVERMNILKRTIWAY